MIEEDDKNQDFAVTLRFLRFRDEQQDNGDHGDF